MTRNGFKEIEDRIELYWQVLKRKIQEISCFAEVIALTNVANELMISLQHNISVGFSILVSSAATISAK